MDYIVGFELDFQGLQYLQVYRHMNSLYQISKFFCIAAFVLILYAPTLGQNNSTGSLAKYELIKKKNLTDGLEVAEYRLKNGLRVVIVKDTTEPIFAYQTFFRVGSVHEPPGHQGIAHFLEHLMFRTRIDPSTISDLSKMVKLKGGRNFNAGTSRDGTVFHVLLPKDQLEFIVEIESRRMADLSISPEMYINEKEAILTEKSSENADPINYLWNAIYRSLYTVHNYRNSVIGEAETIENVTLDDIMDIHRNFFKPNNALIVVAGDVVPEDVIELIDKYYGHIPTGKKIKGYKILEPKPEQDRFLTLMHPKTQLYTISNICRLPDIEERDRIVLSIFAHLLELTLKAQLENASIVTIRVSPRVHAYDYFFILVLQSTEKIEVKKIQNTLDQIFDFFRDDVNETLLKVAIEEYRQSLYFIYSQQQELAKLLGESYLKTGDPLSDIDVLNAIDQVGAENIKRVVRQYFYNQPMHTTLLSPDDFE